MTRRASLLGTGLSLLSLVAFACAPQAGPAAKPAPAAGAASAQAPAQPGQPAQPAAAAPSAPTTLVVGHFPATHTAGVYIAQERGYFAEQGLDADLTPFQSLPDAALLLNSGQMDVYAGGTGANLYNAVARGIALKAVADKAHSEAGVKYKAFTARKDLWDSGEVRTIADLKGRPVAGLASGGGVEYQMEKVLATANLTMDDVNYKGLGVPEQMTALANKAPSSSSPPSARPSAATWPSSSRRCSTTWRRASRAASSTTAPSSCTTSPTPPKASWSPTSRRCATTTTPSASARTRSRLSISWRSTCRAPTAACSRSASGAA
ncbi:MAG TPA: ABC transporter substrate-binding protein [Chloroflexota bacterium]|jgi:hypothetical protein